MLIITGCMPTTLCVRGWLAANGNPYRKTRKKEHALPDGGAGMRLHRSRITPIHRQHGVLLNETRPACESVKIRHLTVLVGVRGLEPPTSASRTLRASHLRYTPKMNRS
jgi:hypothetical protein